MSLSESNDTVRTNLASDFRFIALAKPQQEFQIGGELRCLEAFGFKLTVGGAHISRTIMLKEINRLLASAAGQCKMRREDYQRAVIGENVLGKATETTRQKTFRHLRELYALSPKVPIFSVYRELMKFDPTVRTFAVSVNRLGARSAPSGDYPANPGSNHWRPS